MDSDDPIYSRQDFEDVSCRIFEDAGVIRD